MFSFMGSHASHSFLFPFHDVLSFISAVGGDTFSWARLGRPRVSGPPAVGRVRMKPTPITRDVRTTVDDSRVGSDQPQYYSTTFFEQQRAGTMCRPMPVLEERSAGETRGLLCTIRNQGHRAAARNPAAMFPKRALEASCIYLFIVLVLISVCSFSEALGFAFYGGDWRGKDASPFRERGSERRDGVIFHSIARAYTYTRRISPRRAGRPGARGNPSFLERRWCRGGWSRHWSHGSGELDRGIRSGDSIVVFLLDSP
ncbi:hypothetical protein QBC39DRAFT_74113 [Podospora conica]|nr:hypothetical protein QBC39DRAFT_74113 [Schizothecium conicum]